MRYYSTKVITRVMDTLFVFIAQLLDKASALGGLKKTFIGIFSSVTEGHDATHP